MTPTTSSKRPWNDDSDDRDRKRQAKKGLFGNGSGVKGLECWYFFAKGSCRWGDQCKYSHMATGRRAEQPVPDAVGTTAGTNARQNQKVYTKWQGTKKPKVYEPPITQRLAAIEQLIASGQSSNVTPEHSYGSDFKIRGRATTEPNSPQVAGTDLHHSAKYYSSVDRARREESLAASGCQWSQGQLAEAQTNNLDQAYTFSGTGAGSVPQAHYHSDYRQNSYGRAAVRDLDAGYHLSAHYSLELPVHQQNFRNHNPPPEFRNNWRQDRPVHSYVSEKLGSNKSSLTPPSVASSLSAYDGRGQGNRRLGSYNLGSSSTASLSAPLDARGEANKVTGPHHAHPGRQQIFADRCLSQPIASQASEATRYSAPVTTGGILDGQSNSQLYDHGDYRPDSSLSNSLDSKGQQRRPENNNNQSHTREPMVADYDPHYPDLVDQESAQEMSSGHNDMFPTDAHRGDSQLYGVAEASIHLPVDTNHVTAAMALSPSASNRRSTRSSRRVSADSTHQLRSPSLTVSTATRPGTDNQRLESSAAWTQVHELGAEPGERNHLNGPRQPLSSTGLTDLHSNFSPADASFLTKSHPGTDSHPCESGTRKTSTSNSKPFTALPAILSLPENATATERAEHGRTVIAELTQHVRWLSGIQIVGRRLKAWDQANGGPPGELLPKQVDSAMGEVEKLLQTVQAWKDGLEKTNDKNHKKIKAKVVGWEKYEKQGAERKETEMTEKAFI